MRTAGLLIGMFMAGCVSTAGDNLMSLELKTSTAREGDRTIVSGFLHNSGSGPVTVLLEYQLHDVSPQLTDEQGRAIRSSRDARAGQGRRSFRTGHIKAETLLPGQSVDVDSFDLAPAFHRASSQFITWEELDREGRKTVTLEMSYEVTQEGAQIAKDHGAPEVAIGRWTSAPVTLKLRD